MIYVFEGKSQKQALENQTKLYHHQRLKDLKVQDSLFFPPIADKDTPIKNNITEITTEATATTTEKSPLTKGWIIANTIKATAKFINDFPSSLRPLNQFIKKLYNKEENMEKVDEIIAIIGVIIAVLAPFIAVKIFV